MKKPYHIVYIGGSVTTGLYVKREEKFTNRVQEALEQLPEYESITNDNLAEVGTQSTYGLYLAATTIEKRNPDVVVIEYAINDTKEDIFRVAFESLVVRLLHLPSKPIVSILITVNQEGYSCRGFMTAVAVHYGIPVLDAGKRLQEQIKDGTMAWENYSDDFGHPNPSGHAWLATQLVDWMSNEVLPNREKMRDYILPEKFYNTDLADLYVHRQSWISTENKNMKITFTGQYLFLLYIVDTSSDMGTAELIVDNKKELIQAYRIGSWRHVVPQIIRLRDVKEHKLTIRMQAGESRKYFELLDVGSC